MLYTYGHVAQQKRRPEPPSHSSTSSKLAQVGQKTEDMQERQRAKAYMSRRGCGAGQGESPLRA